MKPQIRPYVVRIAWVFAACLAGPQALAATYELDPNGANVFGQNTVIQAQYEDTLTDLARRYSLGWEEITRVNRNVDPWLPGAGTEIIIPGERILPPGPREGIVVNLPEHRMYYFPKPKKGEKPVVITYPVSIGKMDWRTPIGKTRIVDKRKNPIWYPPASVRKEHAARGEPLPAAVPAGPENPLGAYAMRLAIPGGSYLIHGTNNPAAVGMAITHGCLRMYPEDVEALFPLVPVNTPVWLINEPIKFAWIDGQLLIEVHPPVDAQGQTIEPNLEDFSKRLDTVLGPAVAAVNWDIAIDELRASRGMPALVGIEAEIDFPVALDVPEESEDAPPARNPPRAPEADLSAASAAISEL